MHILMQNEFLQGLNMMKYSVNHPWKFRSVSTAFFTGFMQLSISFIIEIANVYILLANGLSQFDIVSNFIIMLIIAEFDNYFHSVRDNADDIKSMITDSTYDKIFVWETTTSRDACAKIPENELKPEMTLLACEKDLRPKYILLEFGERKNFHKFLFVIYKFCQIFYTSIFYYFIPFLAQFGVFILLLNVNMDEAGKKFDKSSEAVAVPMTVV